MHPVPTGSTTTDWAICTHSSSITWPSPYLMASSCIGAALEAIRITIRINSFPTVDGHVFEHSLDTARLPTNPMFTIRTSPWEKSGIRTCTLSRAGFDLLLMLQCS